MARYLYHWTLAINLDSIAADGLDPAYATGKRRVVWLADEARAMWGMCHAAKHQSVSPDQMVCLRVRVDGLRLLGTAWSGVKNSAAVIKPSRLSLVTVKFATGARRLKAPAKPRN